MPRPILLKELTGTDLVKTLGKPKTFAATYPKTPKATQELKSAFKQWQSRQAVPSISDPRDGKISGVRLRATDVTKLRTIIESTSPTAEAVVGQKMGPDQVLGTLYSSFTALEFTKMEGEFRKRMTAASAAKKAQVQAEWDQVVKAAQTAYAAAGVKNLSEADLRAQSQELGKSRANFNAITNMANTGKPIGPESASLLSARSSAVGAFVPQVGLLPDPEVITTTIAGLCDKPFAEGVFTKHFSKSFNLTVRLKVWCPTWSNPFRTCMKKFTLAGVSFSVGIQVGYRVTCCGATAWGQAHVEACATVIGIKVCAGCTATITGVAGIGRSGSGSTCTYGLGINAQLKCTFAGITVFQVQVPFGFNVNGPCPPTGLC